MTTPTTITSEIQKLAPSAVIELYQLDTTSFGGDILYFHAGTNGLTTNVVWQGQIYNPFPVKVTGFEFNGNGQLPRPKLVVANMSGVISALTLVYQDLLGAKLTRKRTFAKYLDAVNFDGSVNPSADSTAEFQPDIFFIDRKSGENQNLVEFELAAAFDVTGVKLPRRQIIQNLCPWKYRGAECGYVPQNSYRLKNHYKDAGYFEGRNINASGQFNASYYLSAYADIAAAGYTLANVYQHFLMYGIFEGRAGNSGGAFDTSYYLTTYTDLNTIVYYNVNDVGQLVAANDACSKRLDSCKIRFGVNQELPFGGFPAAGLFR